VIDSNGNEIQTDSAVVTHAIEDEMDLEFGDEAEPVNKRSFIENKTSTETRRQ
jgi:hypothetical protein